MTPILSTDIGLYKMVLSLDTGFVHRNMPIVLVKVQVDIVVPSEFLQCLS